MSAPCSRCDCATFKGEAGEHFCLACWHPRGAHHLMVCPECGATITPVRIPLEAASLGEGWVGIFSTPVVSSEQQALWEQGRTGDVAAEVDEPTLVPLGAAASADREGDAAAVAEDGRNEPAAAGADEPEAGADEAAAKPQAPVARRRLRQRLRRHAKA